MMNPITMNPIATISSFASDATLLAAADAILKATLILGSAAVASTVLRHASAAVRHLIWTLALIAALAMPALSFALPRWEMPIVTLPSAQVEQAVQPVDQNDARVTPAPPIATATNRANAEPSGTGTAPATQPARVRQLPAISWQRLVAFIWLAGMLAVAARLVVGLVAVAWMSRKTELVINAPWLPFARELAAEIGISPNLNFMRSSRTTMPMAWGIFRPSVLMPADADNWPLERLRIVLLHELAHVKRRDCLTHALAQIACAVYWFNPLFWIAVRHARTERERACDDLVLATGTPGTDYADQLLEIARVMRAGRFPALITGATLAMAHRSQLEGRLIAILDPKTPRTGLSGLRTAMATALAACVIVPVAAVQPWTYEVDDADSAVRAERRTGRSVHAESYAHAHADANAVSHADTATDAEPVAGHHRVGCTGSRAPGRICGHPGNGGCHRGRRRTQRKGSARSVRPGRPGEEREGRPAHDCRAHRGAERRRLGSA